jgi:prolyl oligopeptidase
MRELLDRTSFPGTEQSPDHAISEDGGLMAYGLATAGSDWQEWKVRDVRWGKPVRPWSGKVLLGFWTHDGQGFSTAATIAKGENKLKSVNYFQKLYYHRVGSPQSADELLSSPRPKGMGVRK